MAATELEHDTGHAEPRAVAGVLLALLAAGAFATSGPFAKSLLVTGWSPGAVVTLRVVGGAVLLLPFAWRSVRERPEALRRNWRLIAAYGLVAVAGCQLAYFMAVETLSVAVALLLEYLGLILVVGWLWVRHGNRPDRLTTAGVVLSLLGLLLVLDVLSGARISFVGVGWGLLAATGLATFFVVSAHEPEHALPGIALAGFGLAVGAVVLTLASLTGLTDWRTASEPVVLAGTSVPWWVPLVELAVVAAALAYATGIAAARLVGAKLASFLGLAEVLFAVLFAWLLLGELPRPVQLVGGVLIVGGVVAVRVSGLRERSGPAGDQAGDADGTVDAGADFPAPTPFA